MGRFYVAITAASLEVALKTSGKDRVKSDLAEVGGAVEKTGRSVTGMSTALATGVGFLGAQIFTKVTSSLWDMGAGFINANANAEAFFNQLTVATGDVAKAQVIFDNMKQFAKDTPFEFPELIQGAANLEAFGQSSQLWMPIIGDTAAATNKSIDQTIQAVLDAQTGEFERLKEFGIRTRTEGDKVVFSFMRNGQMMEVVADNTSEGISNALMGIWDTNYDGAMETMSKTFIGRLSTLKDNVSMLMQDLTRPIFNGLKAGMGIANDFFDEFNRVREAGLSPLNAALHALQVALSKALGGAMASRIMGTVRRIVRGLEDFFDIASDIADVVGGALADAFRFLGRNLDILMPALAGVAALFGAMLAWGGLVTIITGIAAAIGILLSPLGLLIGAAALLGVAWSKNWGDIQGKTAEVVDWFQSTAWPHIQEFATNVGNVLGNIADQVGPTLTLLGELAGYLNSEFFVPALDWARFIVPIAWNAILESPEWATLMIVLDWADFIAPIVWEDFLNALDWGIFIGYITWTSFVELLEWAEFVAPIAWETFVGTLEWLDFIALLAWSTFVGTLAWADFISKIVWSTHIGLLEWADFIATIVWSTHVGLLEWADFVSVIAWSTFVGTLDWLDYVVPLVWDTFLDVLSWSSFVGVISWATFIPQLVWPNITKEDILNAILPGNPFGGSSDQPEGGNAGFGPGEGGGGGGGGNGWELDMAGNNAPTKWLRMPDLGPIKELRAQITGLASDLNGTVGPALDSFGSKLTASLSNGAATATSAYASLMALIGPATAKPLAVAQNAVSSGMANIIATVANSLSTVVSVTTSLMSAARSAVVSAMASIVQAGASGMASYRNAVQSGMNSAVAAVRSGVNAMVGAASTGRGAMSSAGVGIGAALGQGIAAGIRGQIGAVAAAASAIVTTAISSAKRAGGIASPSRFMRLEVGRNLGLGAVLGVMDLVPRMDAAMNRLVSIPSIDPYGGRLAVGGYGGSFATAPVRGGDTYYVVVTVPTDEWTQVKELAVNAPQRVQALMTTADSLTVVKGGR